MTFQDKFLDAWYDTFNIQKLPKIPLNEFYKPFIPHISEVTDIISSNSKRKIFKELIFKFLKNKYPDKFKLLMEKMELPEEPTKQDINIFTSNLFKPGEVKNLRQRFTIAQFSLLADRRMDGGSNSKGIDDIAISIRMNRPMNDDGKIIIANMCCAISSKKVILKRNLNAEQLAYYNTALEDKESAKNLVKSLMVDGLYKCINNMDDAKAIAWIYDGLDVEGVEYITIDDFETQLNIGTKYLVSGQKIEDRNIHKTSFTNIRNILAKFDEQYNTDSTIQLMQYKKDLKINGNNDVEMKQLHTISHMTNIEKQMRNLSFKETLVFTSLAELHGVFTPMDTPALENQALEEMADRVIEEMNEPGITKENIDEKKNDLRTQNALHRAIKKVALDEKPLMLKVLQENKNMDVAKPLHAGSKGYPAIQTPANHDKKFGTLLSNFSNFLDGTSTYASAGENKILETPLDVVLSKNPGMPNYRLDDMPLLNLGRGGIKYNAHLNELDNIYNVYNMKSLI